MAEWIRWLGPILNHPIIVAAIDLTAIASGVGSVVAVFKAPRHVRGLGLLVVVFLAAVIALVARRYPVVAVSPNRANGSVCRTSATVR